MSFFGKNIKKIRGIKRLSQQAFADIFELKRATLGAYEEGRSEPKIATIIKVANYFSISIDSILTKEITVNEFLRFNDAITTDVNQIVKSKLVQVPFVDALNMSEFKSSFVGKTSYESLPKLSLPVQERTGLLAFEVQDLYMVSNEEGMYPGDVVVGMECAASDLQENDVVLLLHDDVLCVRRYSSNESSYVLKADHAHIPPLALEHKIKVHFWKVDAVFLKHIPKNATKLEDRINQLDAKLAALSDKK